MVGSNKGLLAKHLDKFSSKTLEFCFLHKPKFNFAFAPKIQKSMTIHGTPFLLDAISKLEIGN
jgi:hypothetical protein